MQDIYWLSQIKRVEKNLVGEQLFVLSQLLQHECPVLPGFILSNRLCQEFLLSVSDELLIEHDGNQKLSPQEFDRHHRRLIEQIQIPTKRQGEILRAAQQFNTPGLILQPFITDAAGKSLEITSLWRSPSCSCTLQALTTAIKSIWADFFAVSSLIFWQKMGLTREQLNLSILVRPLKSFDASGTVAIEADSIQIKATWGLESSILQGDVEADEYYLERDFGQIVDRRLGHKNYGYRCQPIQQGTVINDCLEAYLPSADLAAAYVLDTAAIAQLEQLVQDILRYQPQTKYLVWSAFKTASDPIPQFYWTQVSDRLKINPPSAKQIYLELSTLDTPLLSGIAMSPGAVEAKVTVIPNLDTQTQAIAPGTVLVTRTIDPQHLVLIKQVKGIITEVGGKNSHAGIVARELNVPGVANVPKATETLMNGDRIILDGDQGSIYRATNTEQTNLPVAKNISKNILAPTYPIATKLMVNLSQPESIIKVANLPIDGVGLLRSELMLAELLSSQTLAQWQESFQRQFVATLADCLRQFTKAFANRPVFYRSLDLYAQSDNSVLGDRGTYSYINNPTLFDLELEAIQTVLHEGNCNLKLLLPFVRSLEEFQFCYGRLQQIGLTFQDSFQVWMMIEVPSAVVLLPEYIRAGVQGIAIGSNDLTQLLLGVDREQIQFSDRGLNANHPAMQKAFANLIQTAHEYQIECCICGQAPVEHPDLIDRLIEWGIDTISVEPNALAQTYRAIARAEKRLLLKAMKNN
ncbi:MAG: putative PEP-binding protein [Cyanobacteria bacterium J06600_6]